MRVTHKYQCARLHAAHVRHATFIPSVCSSGIHGLVVNECSVPAVLRFQRECRTSGPDTVIHALGRTHGPLGGSDGARSSPNPPVQWFFVPCNDGGGMRPVCHDPRARCRARLGLPAAEPARLCHNGISWRVPLLCSSLTYDLNGYNDRAFTDDAIVVIHLNAHEHARQPSSCHLPGERLVRPLLRDVSHRRQSIW